MSKFTPWFSGAVKPSRPGVYQRQYGERAIYFCRWDGARWFAYETSPRHAEGVRTSSHIVLPWRGLAKEPK